MHKYNTLDSLWAASHVQVVALGRGEGALAARGHICAAYTGRQRAKEWCVVMGVTPGIAQYARKSTPNNCDRNESHF